jgi:hypothetical protein
MFIKENILKIRFLSFIILCSFLGSYAHSQNGLQLIRGNITDKQSQQLLIGVKVCVIESDPLNCAQSDSKGNYRIQKLKPGRYDLKFSYLGYKEVTMPNVIVTSGKETILDISMEESVVNMKEIKITPRRKELNNTMTSVSGRSFSMEEVNRYAGGRSDPARLASNFAGVSSPDDSRNDLVIRGNSPVGVLWRVEGLNIPNPNHFSTIGTTGGPVSAINTNLLRNSDFMTSAFPSEYGNANAGVFDLGFRDGNTEKRENTFQFGLITGIEFMTEGPIRKDNGSSYVFAYRYGFPGMAKKLGLPIGTFATPYYQDFSFKINSGETKLGRFTLFGVGAVSRVNFEHDKIDSTDLFAIPNRDGYFNSQIGLLGLKHVKRLNFKSFINTVIGINYGGSGYLQDSISVVDSSPVRTIENLTNRLTYSLNSSYNNKISARLFLKAGAIAELFDIKLLYRSRENQVQWLDYWNTNTKTALIQTYVHAKYNFTDNLTLNTGIHGQYLSLNHSYSIEPRIGLRYKLFNSSSLNLGYGLHSQMQPMDSYFFQSFDSNGDALQTNKNMGFTRSHHAVIGYEWKPSKLWLIKTEIYYQYLWNVPVNNFPSSYSMLNAGATYYPNNQVELVNDGTGENYGLELTIERYFGKGFYGMAAGSLYESKYTGSDKIERNTAFNGKFVYNVLIGKEIKVGKDKQNAFTFDIKFTHAGGRHYTPINLALSQLIDFQVLMGDDYAYTKRYPDFLRLDVKAGFTLNSKKFKLSQSWAFDINNVTNNKNIFADRYNPTTNNITTAYQIGFFPNFVYRVQF